MLRIISRGLTLFSRRGVITFGISAPRKWGAILSVHAVQYIASWLAIQISYSYIGSYISLLYKGWHYSYVRGITYVAIAI